MSPASPNPNLDRFIVDYPVDDMTITVRADITAAQLAAVLSQNRHQLPIDPLADQQTIRDLVDNDTAGPRQYGRGTLRDYVIGIEAVDGHHRRFHAGGRVVKNVAGYDLCRLLIGARGQLGAVTQVTFKLSPLPPGSALLAASFNNTQQLSAALDKLNISSTTPVILDVLNHIAATEICTELPLSEFLPALANSPTAPTTHLFIGFEGPVEACRWQLAAITSELAATASHIHSFSAPDAFARWCRISQQHAAPAHGTPWLSQITLLPSRVASAIDTASTQHCAAFGRAGNGVLWIRPAHNSSTAEAAVLEPLRRLIPANSGSLLVLKGTNSYNTASTAPVSMLSTALQTALAATAEN